MKTPDPQPPAATPDCESEYADLMRLKDSILSSAGEGIYGLDAEGRTTFVNPAAEAMLGWLAEELIGKPQHDIIHHTRADRTPYAREACPIYAALRDGTVHREEDEVFWRKDGSCMPVEYVSTPILDAQGRVEGAVVSFFDITERKQQRVSLERALAEVEALKDRLAQENRYLQQEIQVQHNFEEIIGQSEALQQTLHRIEQVAGTDATVLITGESGVGKELFARSIHHLSRRRDRPLVKVNCAALPANLIESELFGHTKGAFTGATESRIGRFELANGGTLFLDEIGELPIDLQPKLLRVLQEGELERIGSASTVPVDVRILAATNRDLVKSVWAGDFRDDLYYRLNVFPVEVPPLRERHGDIPLLVAHFVRKASARIGKRIEQVPESVQRALESYAWPGNVRELENIVERAVILSQDGVLRIDEALTMRSLERPSENGASSSEVTAAKSPTEAPSEADRRSLAEVERGHIEAMLHSTGWRVEGRDGAAEILGMRPSTLRSRMAKLGIERP